MCLADYCDIMRCEVFLAQETNNQFLYEKNQQNTDVEVWRETTVYRTALTLTGPTEVAKVVPKGEGKFPQEIKNKKMPLPIALPTQNLCSKVRTSSFYIDTC